MSPPTARIHAPLTALSILSCALCLSSPVQALDGSFETTRERYFPNAMSITVVAANVRSCLASQNFSRSNTLFGTSSSPDEINTKEESLCKVQEGYLSKDRGVYTLGEIGGWPLSGIESMKDFLSHSPRKGRVFLLFGPNIGINDDGALRKIERLGHSWLSECCEPGLNAYYIQEGKASEGTLQYNELDSQMQFVMTTLKNYIRHSRGLSNTDFGRTNLYDVAHVPNSGKQ